MEEREIELQCMRYGIKALEKEKEIEREKENIERERKKEEKRTRKREKRGIEK